jgi:DNA-binding SARP family transcriptional activator
VAVLRGGERVELRSRQLRLLVAYVAEHAGRTIAREELGAAVWEEAVPDASAVALRALLCRLRATVPVVEGDCGGVRLADGVEVDIHTARRAVEAAELALDSGAPAAALRFATPATRSLAEPCCPGLTAHWLDALRSTLEDLHDGALTVACRAGADLDGAHLAAAVRTARLLCRRRPHSESAHALLMELQAAAGDAAEALWTYEAFRRRLDDDLGAFPTARARALHAQLLDPPAAAAA